MLWAVIFTRCTFWRAAAHPGCSDSNKNRVPSFGDAPCPSRRNRNLRRSAANAAEQGLKIQREVDSSEAGPLKARSSPKRCRRERGNIPRAFPEQHLAKPGHESDVAPQPMYDAPGYKGSEKLKDKVAIITGGDSGIGRAVAVLYAREGADVAIVYLNEHKDAEDTKKAVEAEGRRCILIAGDVSKSAFLQTGGRTNRARAWPSRHPGQQRRLPGARRRDRRPYRRTFRPHPEDESLWVLLHGKGSGQSIFPMAGRS